MDKSFIAEHKALCLDQVWFNAYKQNGGQSGVCMARELSGLRELCTFTLVLKDGISLNNESPGKPGPVFAFRVYIDDNKYIFSRWY